MASLTLFECLPGDLGRALTSGLGHFVEPGGVGFERTASFPNGRELRHDAIRHKFLAVDAADFCRTAFFVDLVDDRGVGIDLVEVKHRAEIRVSRIGSPHPGRVGDPWS